MAMKVGELNRITITRPDDWHLHLRDGASMESVVAATARVFGRAIIMPNMKPPVTTVDQAFAYQARILDALPYDNSAFQPRMTLYLTDQTSPAEIERAKKAGIIGCKLYPAGATTNSDDGVTDIRNCDAVLARMEEVGMPLLVHGEVTDPTVDIFDREAVFIERVLIPLRKRYPDLRIVFEHITTRDAVQYVRGQDKKVAATITAHHLLLNRNAIFAGGIRPHHYCLPVLKREEHRKALLRAATSGNPKFFLGTDSAPHAVGTKEAACGCAGCYTAPVALETYAEVFERAGAVDRLEGFASIYGARFYGLPRNNDTVTLRREPWQVTDSLPFGDSVVVPFRAGELVHWQLAA